ncbi:unnamed protein product, partial [Gulo gulo]
MGSGLARAGWSSTETGKEGQTEGWGFGQADGWRLSFSLSPHGALGSQGRAPVLSQVARVVTDPGSP